jgi:hypothetical protein
VDVEYATGKPVNEAFRQHTHETGENNAFGPMSFDSITNHVRKLISI